MQPSLPIRLAGVTYVALGLGFGVGTLVVLARLARDGELPMTPWGFRALSGPSSASTRSSSLRSASHW